jgi:hypothetical protein
MALRRTIALPRMLRSAARIPMGISGEHRRGLATAVPPVTQDATGSKGPTAMVFLNMGGPSTTAEVEDFLSRLFVRLSRPHGLLRAYPNKNVHDIGRRRLDSPWSSPKLSRSAHCEEENAKDPKTVCGYRRRFAYQKMVRVPMRRDV